MGGGDRKSKEFQVDTWNNLNVRIAKKYPELSDDIRELS